MKILKRQLKGDLVKVDSLKEMTLFLRKNILFFPDPPMMIIGTKLPLSCYMIFLAENELLTFRRIWEQVRMEEGITNINFNPNTRQLENGLKQPRGTIPTWIGLPKELLHGSFAFGKDGEGKSIVKEILFLKNSRDDCPCSCVKNHFSRLYIFKEESFMGIECPEKERLLLDE